MGQAEEGAVTDDSFMGCQTRAFDAEACHCRNHPFVRVSVSGDNVPGGAHPCTVLVISAVKWEERLLKIAQMLDSGEGGCELSHPSPPCMQHHTIFTSHLYKIKSTRT